VSALCSTQQISEHNWYLGLYCAARVTRPPSPPQRARLLSEISGQSEVQDARGFVVRTRLVLPNLHSNGHSLTGIACIACCIHALYPFHFPLLCLYRRPHLHFGSILFGSDSRTKIAVLCTSHSSALIIHGVRDLSLLNFMSYFLHRTSQGLTQSMQSDTRATRHQRRPICTLTRTRC
jgi:hypothetical protein